MERLELAAIGRSTSRIGLGCGRLVGGAGAAASTKVIEAARQHGITHFDVAPSYGLGLAENVLGDVIGDDPDVTIATKIGISRPAGGGAMSVARRWLKPVADALPFVKRRLIRSLPAAPRDNFTIGAIAASFDESLRRLKRDAVTMLLLHEAKPESVSEELETFCQDLMASGRIEAFGSSSGGGPDRLTRFGSVAQCRWSADAHDLEGYETVILHGAIRQGVPQVANSAVNRASSGRLGFDLSDPEALAPLMVTAALATRPEALILISSNDPRRIQSIARGIDWAAANGRKPDFLPAFRHIFGSLRR